MRENALGFTNGDGNGNCATGADGRSIVVGTFSNGDRTTVGAIDGEYNNVGSNDGDGEPMAVARNGLPAVTADRWGDPPSWPEGPPP